jgi:AraC-like DNA-binding protein
MRPTEPTEYDSAAILLEVVDHLQQAGVSRAKLLQHAGIDPAELQSPDGRVRSSAESSLWPWAVQESGDAAIGLHVGEKARIQSLGLVGYTFLNCATLGESLERLIRYQNLVTTHLRVTLRTRPAAAVVSIQSSHEPSPRERIEHTAATMITLARWMTGREVPLEIANFRHARPTYAEEYERVFACRVQFEQQENSLYAHRSTLQIPLFQPNPGLLSTLEGLLDASARLLEQGAGYLSKVRREIDGCMELGEVTLESVASRLAMTPRTLQRRLRDEGTTFRRMLDDYRRELASRYLTNALLTVDEVAYLLGFSESSAFHKAFKRWTSKAPAEFRRGLNPE